MSWFWKCPVLLKMNNVMNTAHSTIPAWIVEGRNFLSHSNLFLQSYKMKRDRCMSLDLYFTASLKSWMTRRLTNQDSVVYYTHAWYFYYFFHILMSKYSGLLPLFTVPIHWSSFDPISVRHLLTRLPPQRNGGRFLLLRRLLISVLLMMCMQQLESFLYQSTLLEYEGPVLFFCLFGTFLVLGLLLLLLLLFWGFPTRMVYLKHDIWWRYTILVLNHIPRVPNQNCVSQAWYMVEIRHSGGKPSIYSPHFVCLGIHFMSHCFSFSFSLMI